jgi:type VI secretion system protein ImpG
MTGLDERLLELYEAELRYLQDAGADFARRYPKLAGRLELGSTGSGDPHIERLLESFAFLTARLNRKLERDLATVPAALLQGLYPALADPVPASAVAAAGIDPEVPPPPSGLRMPRGTTLHAPAGAGTPCRFRTAFDVDLYPVRVSGLTQEPPGARDLFDAGTTDSVLRFTLSGSGASLEQVGMDSLRLFLDGPRKHATKVFELLLAESVEIVLVGRGSGRVTRLDPDAAQAAGMDDGEALLPDRTETHPAYRLLKEYFTLPEKFLFFTLTALDRRPDDVGVDVLFALRRRPPAWLDLSAVQPRVGCTPVLNLFQVTAEPIALTHRVSEYRVIPELGGDDAHEVHSVASVAVTGAHDGRPRELAPYFGTPPRRGDADPEDNPMFWVTRRDLAREGRPGTDTYVAFVEPDLQPARPARETATVRVWCTNRDLAGQLPAGARLHTDLELPATLRLTDRPMPAGEAVHGADALWQLVAQMGLNHLALNDDSGQRRHVETVREMLRLYCPPHRPESVREIMGVVDIRCAPIVRRVGGDVWRGFCEGLEITVVLDESNFAETSAYLFAAVLQHIFSLYAAANTFTELVVVSRQREGVWLRWPPKIGGRALI